MALIWTKTKSDTRYEVRSAGNSLRLYTNGIFHSQWNDKKILSGHLWDLFLLPIFFSKKAPKNALVLGVGGGAAIKQLNHFFPECEVKGVDIDSTHLYIATRFFSCNRQTNTLVHGDAIRFIKQNRKRYDLIIEDVFSGSIERKADAVRTIDTNTEWLKKLNKSLTKSGILIINMESLRQAKALKRNTKLKDLGFNASFTFTTPRYENTIVVLTKQQTNTQQLITNMIEAFGEAKTNRYLTPFQIERL